MLKDPAPKQHALEMVTLEELVPQDHLLRHIARHIDFHFIREATRHLYCEDNGRPAIDPVRLFKMLFIGYLFGIRSERQLVRDIQVNVAYRWFLDLSLTDKVPDASTLSQNRRRRFDGSDIEQIIFDHIVEQAIEQDLIGGKAPLKPSDKPAPSKPTKISTTDPDAGYMVRDQKPEGFFYLDHRTVDGKHNLITDTYVTPGNLHDSRPYLARLDRQCQRFHLKPLAVALDAGYNTAAVCHGLVEREITAVMGYKRPHGPKGQFKRRDFTYARSATATGVQTVKSCCTAPPTG